MIGRRHLKFLVLGGLIGIGLVWIWDTGKNNNITSQASGETEVSLVPKMGQGYGVLLLETNSIEEAEVTSVDIKKTIGEIDLEVVSPKIILAKIEPKQAIVVVGKFHIDGIYFDKINTRLLKDSEDIEWVRRWNNEL